MMESERLNDRIFSYAFYALSGLTLFASMIFHSLAVFFISIIMLVLSAVYYNSGHIVNNFLLKKSKVIEIRNDYSLSSDLLAVSKKKGRVYNAMAIAKMERKNADVEIDSKAIIKFMEDVKGQFEFTIKVVEIDKNRFVQTLETKKGMKEILLERFENKEYRKMNEIQKQISLMNDEINSIKTGGRAYEIETLLTTFSNSMDRIDAEREVRHALERIAASFSVVTGMEYRMLSGEALLEAI